jgi:hypothetical protein
MMTKLVLATIGVPAFSSALAAGAAVLAGYCPLGCC